MDTLTLEQSQTLGKSPAFSATQYRRQFAQLSGAGRSMDLKTPEAREAVASQLVSEMAFKPMLAEMRKFPLANDMFSGGRGEEVFGERLDEQLADIVAGQSDGITQDIAQRLKPRGTDQPGTASAEPAPQPTAMPEAAWWQVRPTLTQHSAEGDGS